jgi:hypothetical protein
VVFPAPAVPTHATRVTEPLCTMPLACANVKNTSPFASSVVTACDNHVCRGSAVSAVVRSRSTSMGSVDCEASYCGARCACTVAGLSSDSDVASDDVPAVALDNLPVSVPERRGSILCC